MNEGTVLLQSQYIAFKFHRTAKEERQTANILSAHAPPHRKPQDMEGNDRGRREM